MAPTVPAVVAAIMPMVAAIPVPAGIASALRS
jgi:hypothetical protein